MSIDELPLSPDTLRKALSEGIEANAKHPRCDDYFVLFGKRAETLEQQGQAELAAAFRFLGIITSMLLNPDNPQQPFQSLWVMESARPPVLDEISDIQIQAVADVVAEATDAEIRARLADIAWIRNRDHQLAQIAVSAYLESGNRLLADPFSSYAIVRFERALQIAARFFRNQPLFEHALNVVVTIASDADRPAFIVAAAIDLLLAYNVPEPEKLARIAEARATCEDANGKPLWQRRFWDHAARFYERAAKKEDANRVRIEVAKTFERDAEQALKREPPSFLTASKFLQDAIQAYRCVPGTETERERIHLQLLAYQQKGRQELLTVTSGPIDLSDASQRAKHAVQGKPLPDAIRILALIDALPRVTQLRSNAEEEIQRVPMAFLFPASTVSATGKVIAKHGTMSSDSDADRESLLLRQMYWFSSHVHRPLFVVGQIEPMRFQILTDHCVRYADFAPLVTYNPLVPPGRERFFVRGLYAGLQGDFVEALHILIPQLENSIRCVLAEQGVIVSSLDAQGLQQENNLNAMLYEPRLTELFGQDLVFELRGLLVEQASSNLRNRLAHGMIEYGELFGDAAVYTWWLILRLCFMGLIAKETP